MLQCPACGSDAVHRSRTRSRWERWRRQITLKAPFRCHGCGARFWRSNTGSGFTHEEIEAANRAIASPPFEGTIEVAPAAGGTPESVLAELEAGQNRQPVGEPELAGLDARFTRRGPAGGSDGTGQG